MPTAKPRVQVTLSTPQHELLRRLAKLQKRSMSSVLEELFEQVYPVLERVAVVLQAAVRAQDSAKEGLRQSMEQGERELRPVLAQAMGQLDLLQMDVERAEREATGSARSALPATRRNPRPVTRGSGLARPRSGGTANNRVRKAKSSKRRAGR
jgi:hypothetical protein